MRKRIVLTTLFCISLAGMAHAQSQSTPALSMQTEAGTGKLYYSEVVPVEGTSQAELYQRAKRWVATTYKSAQSVIQQDDPVAGELLVKGNVPVGLNNSNVRHLLSIAVKDGRYKLDVRDFVFTGATIQDTPFEKPSFGYKKKVMATNEESIQKMAASLRAAMTSVSPAKQDW